MATKPKASAKKPVANKPQATVTSKPVVANKPVAANKPAVPSKPTVATKPVLATANNATKTPVAPISKPAIAVAAKPTPASKVSAKPAVKKVAKKDDKKDSKKDDQKDDKKPKVEKIKMERDSFTMPKDEYAQIALLKARMASMGNPVKKSELLRAGIKLLAAMSDNTLKTTMEKIPTIKTGRPKK